MTPWSSEFTLDCCDLAREAEFWQAATRFEVDGQIGDRYVAMHRHGIRLNLQHVAEPKTVKNRLHLDLLVDNIEREVRQLESLGASRLTPAAREEYGQTRFCWLTLRATSSRSRDETASDGTHDRAVPLIDLCVDVVPESCVGAVDSTDQAREFTAT